MKKKKIKNEPYSSKRYAAEHRSAEDEAEDIYDGQPEDEGEATGALNSDAPPDMDFFDAGDDEEQYVVPKAVSNKIPKNNAAAYQAAKRAEDEKTAENRIDFEPEPERYVPKNELPKGGRKRRRAKRTPEIETEIAVTEYSRPDSFDDSDDFDVYDEYGDYDDYRDTANYMPMWKIILITFLVTVFCSGVVMFFAHGGADPIINRIQGTSSSEPTPIPTKIPVVEYTNMIPFEDASGAVYAVYKSGIAAASANSIIYFNPQGEEQWQINTLIVDPILKTAGDYILIAENGGKKLCLYTQSRMIYTRETDSNIRYANLSSNGDVVVVTDKESYKGAVVAYNKAGDKIFEWFSGTDPIMAAAISPRSRRIAVATISTDSSISSTVMLFNINEKESYASQTFDNTAVFDVQYKNDNLNIVGDNTMSIMSTSGKLVWKAEYYDEEFSHYAIDDDGNSLVLVDEANVPMLYRYNQKGKTEYSLKLGELPDFVDIYSNTIAYNNGREIIISGGKNRTSKSYTATMDVRKLYLIDSKSALIVYNNSLEFIGL